MIFESTNTENTTAELKFKTRLELDIIYIQYFKHCTIELHAAQR